MDCDNVPQCMIYQMDSPNWLHILVGNLVANQSSLVSMNMMGYLRSVDIPQSFRMAMASMDFYDDLELGHCLVLGSILRMDLQSNAADNYKLGCDLSLDSLWRS